MRCLFFGFFENNWIPRPCQNTKEVNRIINVLKGRGPLESIDFLYRTLDITLLDVYLKSYLKVNQNLIQHQKDAAGKLYTAIVPEGAMAYYTVMESIELEKLGNPTYLPPVLIDMSNRSVCEAFVIQNYENVLMLKVRLQQLIKAWTSYEVDKYNQNDSFDANDIQTQGFIHAIRYMRLFLLNREEIGQDQSNEIRDFVLKPPYLAKKTPWLL